MEIVEGKDKPSEGKHARLECEEELGSIIASLCLYVTKSTHGSGRPCAFGSGFGHALILLALRSKGSVSAAVI